jgi:serine/threonine protein kinase
MTEQSPAEAIFFAALEKGTPEERAAYLDAACGNDSNLRRRVERLLAAHPQVGSFLEQPVQAERGPHEAATISPVEKRRTGAGLPETTSYHGPSEGIGSVICGRYKLLETLGQGGMGAVFMAQQTEPVKRLVALKLIKLGMDSRQVLARFEAERQALALMDHPNIAKVLDAGATESGRPFFVMELVKGVPITRFCDERQLSPRERLELFIPICQAIQHAHQKGIIHRDIKPTNVLVALYDDRPVPKVIDFGVAKAAGSQLTDATLVTGFGTIVGTPEYMSPEQAQLNQLDIDTRSDVYALGVLLYELLTGTTPIDRKRLKQDAVFEILRVIREEEPPRPSMRLSTSEALASIAATRKMEPAKLTKLVRGELDWIVMKCLEKDRSRRYETAIGLARDLERYLHDEIVEARPPSAGYRLRKLIRKHRTALATVATIALLLVAGVAVSTWQAVRAKRAESVAKRNEEEADERRKQAEEAKAAAVAAQEGLERETARGVLGPLHSPPDDLSEAESEALWRIGGTKSERLRLRFFEEALNTESTAAQLGSIAQGALHAAIGLDAERRLRVEQILVEGMRDPTRSARHRMEIAWTALALSERGSPVQRECGEVIGAGWAADPDSLTERSPALDPRRASLMAGSDAFAPAVSGRVLPPSARWNLAQSFRGWLADQFRPAEALVAARLFREALALNPPPFYLPSFAQGLVAVAGRLEPKDAARARAEAAEAVTEAFAQARPGTDLAQLAAAAKSVAEWLQPGQARKAAEALKLELAWAQDPNLWQACLESLTAVSGRLDPEEAARVRADEARILGQAVAQGEYRFSGPVPMFTSWSLLVGSLMSLAERMEPAEAARALTEAMRNQVKDGCVSPELAEGLAEVSERLEPNEGARVRGEAARLLSQALGQAQNARSASSLAEGLAAIAGRLEPREAARLCEEAARVLNRALGQARDANEATTFASGLAAVAKRLGSQEAARVCSQAAEILNGGLARETDAQKRANLASGVATLAVRLESKEAARICSQAARQLGPTLAGEKNGSVAESLAAALLGLADWLIEPAEASRVRAQAAGILLKLPSRSVPLARLGQFIARLDGADADQAARAIARLMVNQLIVDGTWEPADVLTYAPREEVGLRARGLAAAVGTMPGSPLGGIAFLQGPSQPLPCRLTTQDLVELLKMPTCLGDWRRIVLDQLGNRYGRRFGTHWDFVRYAQEQKLNLDFTTPPERPDPQLPPLFERGGND